jgi:hypothetical protein
VPLLVYRYPRKRLQITRIIAVLLACTYFLFRTELIWEEREGNSPASVPATGVVSLSLPSTNWETFDKDNAPKAFRINPLLPLGLLSLIPHEVLPPRIIDEQPTEPSNKSPPLPVV